jgi:hypothetical protein
MIEIVHNFDPSQFMWLWAKYVIGFNEKYHCTNSIKGPYSRKFNRYNPLLASDPSVVFDEQPYGSYRAVYVCGVARRGYSTKQNYLHNVHAAIRPEIGTTDEWFFEKWRMTVLNGRFLPIPASPEDIPRQYRSLPTEYTSCRIFRWAVCYFS